MIHQLKMDITKFDEVRTYFSHDAILCIRSVPRDGGEYAA